MIDNQDDELEEQIEAQQEALQDYAEDNSPTEQQADNLSSLFWKVTKIKDSSKVANLDKFELGMLDISVRDLQRIAEIANYLDYPEVANWLNGQAQIVLRTSASKKGWWAELFVSAKRFSSKEKRMGINETQPQQEQSKSFWNRFRKR